MVDRGAMSCVKIKEPGDTGDKAIQLAVLTEPTLNLGLSPQNYLRCSRLTQRPRSSARVQETVIVIRERRLVMKTDPAPDL